MLMSKKIRLKPTNNQVILFWKSAGVSRWSYNYYLSENESAYKNYVKNGNVGVKHISGYDIRKQITKLKHTTHPWLSEVGCNVSKMAVNCAEDALLSYLRGKSGKPKYKSRKHSNVSFYVNYESLVRKQNGFHGEKIGFVRTSEPLPKLQKGTKYSDPHISFDGKYWYLSISYEVPETTTVLTDESLGIDLGVKDLAICSNGKTYKNINKSKEVRRLKKKLKREQRKLSRKLEGNICSYNIIDGKRHPVYERKLSECKNFQKQKRQVKLLYRRLSNIRTNYLHQTTTEIVKTKPYQIVVETLKVQNMMKNKNLAESIQEQKFYEFKRQLSYKCMKYGIELVEVPMWYPSSKICSCCGHVKKDLKLRDRVYRCDHCGLVIDRDFNASINLANYQST